MRLATPVQSEWEGVGESTAVIVAMGLALAVAGIVQTLETPVSQPVVAFELFVSLLVPTGLATGGYWLASRDVSPDVRWRAATRVSIGIVVACALGVWLIGYVTLEGGTIRDPLSLTTTLAAVGGATGFVTAVREPLDAAVLGSSASNGPARATETEPPVPAEPADATARSAAADSSTESTVERATMTPALESSTDVAPATDRPITDSKADSGASRTTGVAARSETQSSPAIWNDTGPRGRTAAPARPVMPPERTESDAPVPDVGGDFRGSRDPLESPLPARHPGVDLVAAVPSTAEAVLDVLRTERARIALAVLYHEWDGEPRSVDELARAVASHTDDSADVVGVGLRHGTLPELAAIRAIEWNPGADRVSASDHAVFEEGVREAAVLLEAFEPGTR